MKKTSWAVRQNMPRNAKTLKGPPPETLVILIVPQLIKVKSIRSEISLRSIPKTSVTPKKHQGIGVRGTFRYFVKALTRALKAASFLRLSVWQTLICYTLCSLYRIPTKSSIAEAVTKESRWKRSLVPSCSITIWGANDCTTWRS